MILVENLCIKVGNFQLRDISFEIPQNAYGILMGKTASGKTTIIETLCGLKRPISGRIFLHGRDVTDLKPSQRGIGYVPQDGVLFSTMTVGHQLGFALTVRRWSRSRIEQRVQELAELLGIKHLLDRKIQGLSGGERQRLSLGRALAARPSILCLDEPLSALDEDTRQEMYALLKRVTQKTAVTTLHITHSQSEALYLGQRIYRMGNGCVIPVTREKTNLRQE